MRAPDVEGTYRGKPGDWVCHLYFAYAGDTQIELIQHVSGTSIFNESLDQHGDSEAVSSPGSSYENTLNFQHAYVNENAAVVVARETGSSTNEKGERHSWEGITNLWCLARTGGVWKITSSIHYLSD